jgi:hypothetical protein
MLVKILSDDWCFFEYSDDKYKNCCIGCGSGFASGYSGYSKQEVNGCGNANGSGYNGLGGGLAIGSGDGSGNGHGHYGY